MAARKDDVFRDRRVSSPTGAAATRDGQGELTDYQRRQAADDHHRPFLGL
jgi:hypothetical protein